MVSYGCGNLRHYITPHQHLSQPSPGHSSTHKSPAASRKSGLLTNCNRSGLYTTSGGHCVTQVPLLSKSLQACSWGGRGRGERKRGKEREKKMTGGPHAEREKRRRGGKAEGRWASYRNTQQHTELCDHRTVLHWARHEMASGTRSMNYYPH